MGEYRFRTNVAKNRLYIHLNGFFREKDGTGVLTKLEATIQELKPGFDVVTDISGFIPCSTEAIALLKKGGEMVKQHGRRHAVRVTGGFVSGLMQFKRVLRGVFDEEAVRYASSIDEADKTLDDMMNIDQEGDS